MKQILLLFLLASTLTLANVPVVATATKVTGNVLMSNETGMIAINTNQKLLNGTRVRTMSDSHAKIVYNDECVVHLSDHQVIEIDSEIPCAERRPIKQITQEMQAIFDEPTGAIGPLLLINPLLAAAGLAGAGAIASSRESVSPN